MFKQIIFTAHATIKLQVLKRHGFKVEKEDVVDAVKYPDKVVKGRKGRFVAQKVYNEKHLIRDICAVRDENAVVVTFYPAKRERYES